MVSALERLDNADRLVLGFVAQHRVVTREAVAGVFPGDAGADATLKRLVGGKLLRVNRSLVGQRSVFQLTRQGASLAGVSPSLARPFGMQALLKHLGVLYLCLASGGTRVRLTEEQLTAVLATGAPEGVHVVARENDSVRVLYCYVPAFTTTVDSVVRRLRRHVYQVTQDPVLKRWVDDRRYGFAVIVGNEHKKKAVERAVRNRDRRGHEPLAKLVVGWVYMPTGFPEVMGMPTVGPVVRGGTKATGLRRLEAGPSRAPKRRQVEAAKSGKPARPSKPSRGGGDT